MIAILILIILAVFPYLRALRGEFLFDDPALFDDSPPAWRFYRLSEFFADNRAVTHLFDSTLWRWFGINTTGMDVTQTAITQPSWPWHTLSMVFHLGTTLAVWGLAGLLFLDSTRAFLAAGIFAVHPLQVQPVTYISARAGVQAAFFSFVGLLHVSAGGWHWFPAALSQYFAWKSKQDGLLYVVLYPVILWQSFA